MIHFQIKQECRRNLREKLLRNWAEKTLDHLQVEDCDLSIVIGNNAEIQQLNREYRHIDTPTDVLSFNYDMDNPETKIRYLGDIIISAEKARDQARQADHSMQLEVCTLIVHGILHLLGYNHEELEDEAVMFALQSKILQAIFENDQK